MRVLSLLICVATVANGFSQHQPKQHPPHHPRYYSDLPPHILASPRPVHPAQYRTLNPAPAYQHRNARSEPHNAHPLPHPHNPQLPPNKPPPTLVASASSTPVLVLKKEHTRPVLSSAVVAAAIAEKRQQQAQANSQIPHDNKPIPTVIMERPGANIEKQEEKPTQQEPQKPEEKSPRHETSLEHDDLSEEPESHDNPASPTASAERRMFFNSVSQNSALSHQVSGPQGPSNPRPRKPTHPHPSASTIQQHRASPQPQRPPHHHDLEDDDEPVERITRSNVPQNPYGNAGFEYPPPQGNFVAQGPTRVPVKYQQGIQGGRPQGHAPNQKPRPYRQRVQQQPGSEEPLSDEEELEDLEEQKPDRLQTLLPNSKFTCSGKKDGYYADDSLACEVFHYCQDGGKHSWLCPDGFAFHQIHLICSPSDKTMCEQSSKFYSVVNSHLYKPINEEEAKQYNTSLKYADRYYPDEYIHGGGDVSLPYQQDDEEEDDRPTQHRQQQPAHNPYAHQQQRPRPQQQQQSPPYNPYASIQSIQQHSPRPSPQSPYATQNGFIPSPQFHTSPSRHPSPQQQQRIQQAYAQQRSGSAPPPHQVQKPPQQKKAPQPHPTAFYSPETINIPLQNRRPVPHHPSHHPQIFKPSPQMQKGAGPTAKSTSRRKYEEDEYEEY